MGEDESGTGSLLDLTVQELLDRVSARTSAPGGGSVAALSTALAAALTAMAARFDESDQISGDSSGDGESSRDGDIVRRADRLRALAAPLADADAAAYGRYLAASRMPAEPDPEPRRQAMSGALSHACDIPLDVAQIAAEVAELAAELTRLGNPRLRGDAAAGALLASSAASTAAFLVAQNLSRSPQDPRTAEAAALAESARTAATSTAGTLLTAATAGGPDQGE